jgi:cation diffusion facilitator family transporter
METARPDAPVSTRFLMKFILLSIVSRRLDRGHQGTAALMTGSVGLLSDALESTVNLVAAFVALWALAVSGKPADHNHDFGHGKAEYMSSLVEGALIFVAAASIIITAIRRFVVPEPVEEIGWGLVLASLATVINLVVGLVLIRKGRQAPLHHAGGRRQAPHDRRVDDDRRHRRHRAAVPHWLAVDRPAHRPAGRASTSCGPAGS